MVVLIISLFLKAYSYTHDYKTVLLAWQTPSYWGIPGFGWSTGFGCSYQKRTIPDGYAKGF